MNPLEEHLSQLTLPEVPASLRDRMLVETGRQIGRREARSWQGLSLALTLALGLSWLPSLRLNTATTQPESPAGRLGNLANHIAPEPPPGSEPFHQGSNDPDYSQWVFDWMVPDLNTTKNLELLRASRLDLIEPLYPPAWAKSTNGPQPIEAITTIIPAEDR